MSPQRRPELPEGSAVAATDRPLGYERRFGGGWISGACAVALGVLGAPHGTRTPLQRLSALGHGSYPRLAADLAAETAIDPCFRVAGSLRLLERSPSPESRARRERAFAESGSAVRWVDGPELRGILPDIAGRFEAALHVPDRVQVLIQFPLIVAGQSTPKRRRVVGDRIQDAAVVQLTAAGGWA